MNKSNVPEIISDASKEVESFLFRVYMMLGHDPANKKTLFMRHKLEMLVILFNTISKTLEQEDK